MQEGQHSSARRRPEFPLILLAWFAILAFIWVDAFRCDLHHGNLALHRLITPFFTPLYESVGYPVHIIECIDIPHHVHLFDGAAVIAQLIQEELCALPNSTLERIIHSSLLNDLRTVFFVHDKRFLSVLANDDFLSASMTREGADRFRSHLVPTRAWRERRDPWSQAQRDKEHWLIKPRQRAGGSA